MAWGGFTASDTSSFRAWDREAPSKVVLGGEGRVGSHPQGPQETPGDARQGSHSPVAAGQVKVSSSPRFFATLHNHKDSPAA